VATGEVKCIDDEIPFEIPATWEWVRIGMLFAHNNGKQLNKGNSSGKLMEYITTSNLYWEGFKLDGLKKMPFIDNEIERCQAVKGDLLVCEGGDIGRACIWPYENTIMLQNHIHKLRAFLPLCTKYFYYIFYLYNQIGIIGGKGIGIQGFSSRALHNTIVPFPPLNEQFRIADRMDGLLPIVEKYNRTQVELDALNESIKGKLQKSILQEAIQGRLVPQIPEEGTAQELLEQIRQEKARMVKEGKLKKSVLSDSTIFRGDDNKYYERVGKEVRCIDEEIPFEIPQGWEWCRLGMVLEVSSARRVHEKDWQTSGVPFYRAREIGKLADYGYVDNDLFIDKSLYEDFIKSGIPRVGDLMMTAVGTLGKTYIVTDEAPFYYKDGSVLCIGNPHRLNPFFLKYFFESSIFSNQYVVESDGTTVATLTMVRLNRYYIPIPPLQEQARIVAKIEELNKIIK
jgi:type I restriction enzyme S subunit